MNTISSWIYKLIITQNNCGILCYKDMDLGQFSLSLENLFSREWNRVEWYITSYCSQLVDTVILVVKSFSINLDSNDNNKKHSFDITN